MEFNGNPISEKAVALIAGLADTTGDIDAEYILADPSVWSEVQRLFPRHLFDQHATHTDDDRWEL